MLEDASIHLIPAFARLHLIIIAYNDMRAHNPKGSPTKQVHIITPYTIPLTWSLKVCITIAPGIFHDSCVWKDL